MAWDLLLGSDMGLASLFTIVFVLVIAIVFARYFSRKMDEDARNKG